MYAELNVWQFLEHSNDPLILSWMNKWKLYLYTVKNISITIENKNSL